MSGRKVEIQHKVNADDLWSIMHQEITENGLSSHATQSANDFYKIGIDQIMTKVFSIEDTIDNTRDKTPQDRQIKKIKFGVEFSSIKLKPPVTSGYCSGHEKMIFPNQAHVEDRTYSSNLYVDAKIRAVAYTHDGQEIERKEEVKNYRLVSIPTMVGSELCNTHNKSRETLLQMREDPRDAKGYFMKSGKEWSVDNMESICFNQPRIFLNAWRNEVLRLEFISKPGDTYQNSKQIIIRLLTNGMLTIELITPKLRGIQFPFYMIFRALGWSTDKELFDHILYKPVGYPRSVSDEKDAKEDFLLEKMLDILSQAMDANYDTKTYKFGGAKVVHSQMEVLAFIVKHMPKELFRDMDLSKDDHVQQAITQILKTIDDDFLPHVGDGEAARHNKLRFASHLINRILYVILEILEPTDRDSYVTKRIHTSGVSMAKTFKTYFNASIVAQIKKQFAKDFKAMSFQSVNLVQTFQISINGADFERLMMQSITSGNQTTLKVNRYRTIVNRLSSQLVDRKNYTKVYSTLRMIISPNSDSSKGSDRAKEMRMPHLSFHGFVDFIQSAEGGEKIGLHKQMGISASICSYGSSESIKKVLIEDKEFMIPIKDVHPYQMPVMSKVFVNGDWIACTKDSSAAIAHYTDLRRNMKIDKYMTIEWDNNMDEIYFWVDYGRIRRPVIIVYNNIRDWKALGLNRPASIDQFEQGVAITPDILRGIHEGKLKMDDLLRLKVIEYLTPGEQIRMDVACDFSHLTHHKNDVLRQFTHCDIPITMLGIASLTGPLSNFNQTPRNTFQTSQTRQTGGIYAFNWAYRIDKDTFLQYQVENPLVSTIINDYIPPNGAMFSVAVACYTGYNEEDSLIFNKITGERLKCNGCWFTYDKVELEKNEVFGIPDITRTAGIKKYANYAKLGKNGIVPVGTIVKKGDIIVGKIKRLPKNIAAEKKVDFSDQSLVYKQEFPAIVHNVILARDDDATSFCKVAYRSLKPIIIGDKFSARSGQKGVCGLIYPQSNMPFTVDGRIPDVIMNPHSFPKRMTIGQPFESVLGKICAKRGVTCDATTFRDLDIDAIVDMMAKLGLTNYGCERLYCGLTGSWIDALIFTGPVFYQRLQKFVAKSIYSIDIGPTDIITRQPLDGKANQGGLRMSELQRDVMLSHGAARFFAEKFYEDSDDFELYVCRCGSRAIVNHQIGLYRCPECGDDADINAIYSAWSSKQFFYEINGMHIGTKFELEPFVLYDT